MKNFKSLSKKILAFVRLSVFTTLVLSVVGCGGGGGANSVEQPDPKLQPSVDSEFNMRALQGRWVSTTNDWVGYWVPPSVGNTKASFWLLSNNNQFMSVIDSTVANLADFTLKGTRYDFVALSPEPLELRGVANLKESPAKLNLSDGLKFTLENPLKEQALQLNTVGSWKGSFSFSGARLADVNLDINQLGIITGDSTGGCGFDGVIAPRIDINIYELKLQMTCEGNVTNLSGIAVLPLAGQLQKLTFALVSADNQAARVFNLDRQ